MKYLLITSFTAGVLCLSFFSHKDKYDDGTLTRRGWIKCGIGLLWLLLAASLFLAVLT